MKRQVEDESGRTIRSVEIVFNIIDILKDNGETGVTELAEELTHSKSTIYSHLQTLKNQGVVVQNNGKYRLSLYVLEMARNVRQQIGNYDIIRAEIDTLAEETGEIAHFGIEEHGHIAYLYKAAGEGSVNTSSNIGKRQPMYATALGKVILAYLPAEIREDIIQQIEYETWTANTISSTDELTDELEEIRNQGYGIDDEEQIEGLRCVAAPVNDGENVFGAVSLTGPASYFTLDRIHEDLCESVRSTANVIELNTKFA